jgi:hypothetical protein
MLGLTNANVVATGGMMEAYKQKRFEFPRMNIIVVDNGDLFCDGLPTLPMSSTIPVSRISRRICAVHPATVIREIASMDKLYHSSNAKRVGLLASVCREECHNAVASS